MGLVLWFGMGGPAKWIDAPPLDRVVRLAALVAGGATAYFGTLWLLGFRPRAFTQKGRT